VYTHTDTDLAIHTTLRGRVFLPMRYRKGFERKSDRTRKTDEGTRFSRAAIWGLLRLGINITGTISSVNPEGALWKLNG